MRKSGYVERRFCLRFGDDPGPGRRAPLVQKRAESIGKRAHVVSGADLGFNVAGKNRRIDIDVNEAPFGTDGRRARGADVIEITAEHEGDVDTGFHVPTRPPAGSHSTRS